MAFTPDEILSYALENRAEIKNAELGIENSDFGSEISTKCLSHRH